MIARDRHKMFPPWTKTQFMGIDMPVSRHNSAGKPACGKNAI
jgi:hypothetical protein